MSKYAQLDILIIIYQLEALCIMVAHVELLIHYSIGKPDITYKLFKPNKINIISYKLLCPTIYVYTQHDQGLYKVQLYKTI